MVDRRTWSSAPLITPQVLYIALFDILSIKIVDSCTMAGRLILTNPLNSFERAAPFIYHLSEPCQIKLVPLLLLMHQ